MICPCCQHSLDRLRTHCPDAGADLVVCPDCGYQDTVPPQPSPPASTPTQPSESTGKADALPKPAAEAKPKRTSRKHRP